MTLRVLYRGPLASCNYDCGYCPFGKVHVSDDVLAADFAALERFVGWVEAQRRPLGILFTPWGEALIHPPYQEAIVRLSRLDHVRRVSAQTNLSGSLRWLDRVVPERAALWVTWHPGFQRRERLLAQLGRLRDAGVACSVGVVGEREHFDAIRWLRGALPDDVYLWVNADKSLDPPYTEDEIRSLEAVDPLFRINTRVHPTRGRACDTGEHAITVDGEGTIRRCHFVPDPIGSIDDPEWARALRPRPCPNDGCRCHIGYVHVPELGLREVFGDGILERIPRAQEA